MSTPTLSSGAWLTLPLYTIYRKSTVCGCFDIVRSQFFTGHWCGFCSFFSTCSGSSSILKLITIKHSCGVFGNHAVHICVISSVQEIAKFVVVVRKVLPSWLEK